MKFIFGKKKQEQRMAKIDARLNDIMRPADKRAAVAKLESNKLNRLIAEANGDLTIKLYLATNGSGK